jgi:3-dehydroquinate synthase
MAIINVALESRAYPILIGSGMLPMLGQFVSERVKLTHAVVISDETVERLHGEVVLQSLRAYAPRVDFVSIPPGEPSKSIDCAAALWEKLLEYGTDRKSVVIALGGGVVGDLAGFIAATFTRGLNFIQIPTTLLAQVDSSVGGKTGINLIAAKNMVGSFWQPRGVLIDTLVLKTQGERDYRSGLAEVVKYGVILDAEFFSYLEEHVAGLIERDPVVLEYVVGRCCELKAQVVTADEREETGLRAVLNYGHTFAHAIEAVSGYGELMHGEAVAIGMECAARMSLALGRIDQELVTRQHQLLAALGLPTTLPALDRDALIQAMGHDKKVEHGKLRFVLPTRMGHVELIGQIAEADVRNALK